MTRPGPREKVGAPLVGAEAFVMTLGTISLVFIWPYVGQPRLIFPPSWQHEPLSWNILSYFANFSEIHSVVKERGMVCKRRAECSFINPINHAEYKVEKTMQIVQNFMCIRICFFQCEEQAPHWHFVLH